MRRLVLAVVAMTIGCSSLVDSAFAQAGSHVTKLDILSVGGNPVSPDQGAVLNMLREGEAIDVVVSGYGVPDDDDVWILLKADAGRAYLPFGPAIRQRTPTGEVFIAADIRVPPGSPQRLYLLRAATLPRDQRPPAQVISLAGMRTFSTPPVSLAVLHAVPDLGGLHVTTIAGQTVEEGRQLAVPANGDVSGRRSGEVEPYVYVVRHAINSDRYELVGPAEVHGDTWYLRDVRFADAGAPHWRLVDLFAVETRQLLAPGFIELASLRDRFVSTSSSARLWLKDEAAPPPVRVPALAFTRYGTFEQALARVPSGDDPIDIEGERMVLEGTVDGLPQGRAVHAVINADGTSYWTVLTGPALLSGSHWTFPQIPLAAPAGSRRHRYSLYVIVAGPALTSGIVDYDSWRSQAVAVSPRLLLEARGRPTGTNGEFLVSITRVSDRPVTIGEVIRLPEIGRVVIDAPDLPPDHQVFLGRNTVGTAAWLFEATVRQPDGQWVGSVPAHTHDQFERGIDETLVAIAAIGSLPAQQLDLADWQPRAVAVSPIVDVFHTPTATNTVLPRIEAAVWPLNPTPGLLLLLAAALAFMIHYLFGGLAPALLMLAEACRRPREYLLSQFRDIPKPDAAASALGLALLAAGVYAVIGYFPIYEHVIQSGLNLPRKASGSLATLLIVSLVLTGAVADTTTRYGRPRRDDGTPGPGGFGYFFAVTLLALIAGALLFFQGVLYFEYYQSRAAEGSLIPLGFGVSAVFIGAVEIMNAFWVTELCLPLAAWLPPYAFITLLWMMETACRIAARLIANLPRHHVLVQDGDRQ